jgi:hypothetical protein
MKRTLLAIVATALLTMALAKSLGVEPANAADGPGRDRDSELLRAAFEGCAAPGTSKGWLELQGGAWRFECRPSLGVAPVKRGTR